MKMLKTLTMASVILLGGIAAYWHLSRQSKQTIIVSTCDNGIAGIVQVKFRLDEGNRISPSNVRNGSYCACAGPVESTGMLNSHEIKNFEVSGLLVKDNVEIPVTKGTLVLYSNIVDGVEEKFVVIIQ